MLVLHGSSYLFTMSFINAQNQRDNWIESFSDTNCTKNGGLLSTRLNLKSKKSQRTCSYNKKWVMRKWKYHGQENHIMTSKPILALPKGLLECPLIRQSEANLQINSESEPLINSKRKKIQYKINPTKYITILQQNALSLSLSLSSLSPNKLVDRLWMRVYITHIWTTFNKSDIISGYRANSTTRW